MYKEKRKTRTVLGQCPSCMSRIHLGRSPRLGQRVTCSGCKEKLEVVWLNPIELDWPMDNDRLYEERDEHDDLDNAKGR